jgi:hypothetical protein
LVWDWQWDCDCDWQWDWSGTGSVSIVGITIVEEIIVLLDSAPITRPERRRIICDAGLYRLCYRAVLLSNKYLTCWLEYLLSGNRVQFYSQYFMMLWSGSFGMKI